MCTIPPGLSSVSLHFALHVGSSWWNIPVNAINLQMDSSRWAETRCVPIGESVCFMIRGSESPFHDRLRRHTLEIARHFHTNCPRWKPRRHQLVQRGSVATVWSVAQEKFQTEGGLQRPLSVEITITSAGLLPSRISTAIPCVCSRPPAVGPAVDSPGRTSTPSHRC